MMAKEEQKRAQETLDRLAKAFDQAMEGRSKTFRKGAFERYTTRMSPWMKGEIKKRVNLE